ncbi:MAG: DUF4352 domain-containing protein [Candidatus Burarchaeum sp.]|nr:DUF4352 domain-containing protein [Candidatus Burarchaeum sp.]MDO8339937.1 DUF4352 domain-containing protein [Candidatus Burarchaeum sp.]
MVGKTRLAFSFFITAAVSLLLISVVLFLLKADNPDNQPEQQIAVPGQPFTVENFRYTITNVHETDSVMQGIAMFASTTTARAGAKFVIFDISIENLGKEKSYPNKGSLFVTDDEGRRFDVAGGRDKVFRESPTIDPGLTAEYVDFYVEVPEDAQGLVLHMPGQALLSRDEGKSYLENAKPAMNASSDK